MSLRPFNIVLRGTIFCETEVDAVLAANAIMEAASKDLEPEEGDEIAVTEVLEHTLASDPIELVQRLVRVRNDLIKTKIKQCWDTAKEIDFIIYGLKYRMDPLAMGSYDHGRIFEITQKVLNGEYPDA